MQLRYQRLLYLGFILIFLIGTPVLIFYTGGYRYNFKKNQLEKTGILVVQTSPGQAQLFLNGQRRELTPARLLHVLPDNYTLELTKTGYYPWRGEVEVASGLTTFVTDVMLFPQYLPTLLTAADVRLFEPSPNHQYLLYSVRGEQEEQIHIVTTDATHDTLVTRLPLTDFDQLGVAAWSTDESQVALRLTAQDREQYLLIDTIAGGIRTLDDTTKLNFRQVRWAPGKSDELFGLGKSILYQINVGNATTQRLLAAEINDFYLQGQWLYVITHQPDSTLLQRFDATNFNEKTARSIKLPSDGFVFEPSPNGWLALRNAKNADLSIVSTKAFTVDDITEQIVLQTKAQRIDWTPNGEQVLMATDFEITTFNLQTREKRTITRQGQPILDAFWHPRGTHIIYQLGDQVRIIENSPLQKNEIAIANVTKINGIAIDPNASQLFINARIGERAGIYQLPLR